jgi:hypothetical protein
VHDLLDIIQKEMLLVDPEQRLMADGLLKELQRCEERAKRNVGYLVKPCPLNRVAPEQSTIHGPLNLESV